MCENLGWFSSPMKRWIISDFSIRRLVKPFGACPTKRDIASRISLNGPQAIGATFGQSSVPIYICEACFHDSENNWSPNINLQKPMTTVQLECENRNCNHEENAEVGR